MYELTMHPKFTKHFDLNKCIFGWISQTNDGVSCLPMNEYTGHFKNSKIDFRFDTAWMNQFPNDPAADDYNYISINGKKTLLRNLNSIAELKDLIFNNL